MRLASRAVYTNTPPNGAFRACNGVYNTFALERHTDEICAAIGMDPLEFRRRNVLGDGDLGSTGQVFEGDVLRPMLDRMGEMRDASASKAHLAGDRLYGRGTAVGTWFVFVGPSAATVNLNADGSATLVTAGRRDRLGLDDAVAAANRRQCAGPSARKRRRARRRHGCRRL